MTWRKCTPHTGKFILGWTDAQGPADLDHWAVASHLVSCTGLPFACPKEWVKMQYQETWCCTYSSNFRETVQGCFRIPLALTRSPECMFICMLPAPPRHPPTSEPVPKAPSPRPCREVCEVCPPTPTLWPSPGWCTRWSMGKFLQVTWAVLMPVLSHQKGTPPLTSWGDQQTWLCKFTAGVLLAPWTVIPEPSEL